MKAADQFIIHDEQGTRLWAGFPWFGSCSRDTFLALPGIALAQGDEKTFTAALDYLISRMQGPFFPHRYYQKSLYFTAVDSPLWFFYVLQLYAKMHASASPQWTTAYSSIFALSNVSSFFSGGDIFSLACIKVQFRNNDRIIANKFHICDPIFQLNTVKYLVSIKIR